MSNTLQFLGRTLAEGKPLFEGTRVWSSSDDESPWLTVGTDLQGWWYAMAHCRAWSPRSVSVRFHKTMEEAMAELRGELADVGDVGDLEL